MMSHYWIVLYLLVALGIGGFLFPPNNWADTGLVASIGKSLAVGLGWPLLIVIGGPLALITGWRERTENSRHERT